MEVGAGEAMDHKEDKEGLQVVPKGS